GHHLHPRRCGVHRRHGIEDVHPPPAHSHAFVADARWRAADWRLAAISPHAAPRYLGPPARSELPLGALRICSLVSPFRRLRTWPCPNRPGPLCPWPRPAPPWPWLRLAPPWPYPPLPQPCPWLGRGDRRRLFRDTPRARRPDPYRRSAGR